MSECDVLIIGAGPVGTALALELALHNVSFRVVDQSPVRSNKSKALVVQARTLELLNRHGAAHELVKRGTWVHGAAITIERKPIAFLNLDGASPDDAEFPLPLMVSQAETEKFLDECLAKYGASVERPVTAKSIVQDEKGVTTELERTSDGRKETVRSKYVVGCDGAHSLVRHSAKNITFEGAAYPQEFALCDARLRDSNISIDRLNMFLGTGLVATIPLGQGLLRLVVSHGAFETSDTSSKPGDDPTLDYFQKALEAYTPPGCGTLYDPVWLTRFRLHHRGVNKYRDGHLFLAGDAAHIHSPAGGQGMNTGIQDSFNLGWKLAAVLRGRDDALLDSYHDERHPIGQQLLRGTDRLFSFVASNNIWFIRLRNFVLPWILPWLYSSRARARTAYQFISELGINYRGSMLVGTASGFAGPVAGGDRLPNGELEKISADGTTATTRVHNLCVGPPHHLLLFAGNGERESVTDVGLEKTRGRIQALLKDEMKTHVIRISGASGLYGSSPFSDSTYLDTDGVVHARYGFDKEAGYVLVRPDAYIAHIGPLSWADELLAFLSK